MYSIDLLENEYLPRSGIYHFFKCKVLWGGTVDRRTPAPVDTEKLSFLILYSCISLHHSTTVSKSLAGNDEVRTSDRLQHQFGSKKRRPCFFLVGQNAIYSDGPKSGEGLFRRGGVFFLFAFSLLVSQKF